MARFITATALVASMALAGAATAQEPGAHFIENWDLDGDGVVTQAEAQTRRGDVFMSFDADDNGILDAEEYAVFDEARANDMAGMPEGGQGLMQGVADGMKLRANDRNGDGRVSRDEFVGGARAWVQGMDRDGDGRVSKGDFAQAGLGRQYQQQQQIHQQLRQPQAMMGQGQQKGQQAQSRNGARLQAGPGSGMQRGQGQGARPGNGAGNGMGMRHAQGHTPGVCAQGQQCPRAGN